MINASLVKELREKTGAGMLDCKKALEETAGDIDASIDWLREKGISKAAKKADRIAAEGLASVLIDGNKAVIVEINSETDFVSKNEEFKELVNEVLKTLIESDADTVEVAEKLICSNGQTIEDYIIAKTAKIGEKLSFRRFIRIEKDSNETFGEYIHMGGRIAVLTILNGANIDVAKDVSMHAAAMRPLYVRRENVPTEVIEHEREVLKEQAINEGKQPEIAEKMVEGRVQKYYKENCLEEQPFVKDQDMSVSTYVKNNGGSILNMFRFEVGEGIEKNECDFATEVMNQIGNK
ncbi:MAG: translation elongation factor Ts [Bacilli bacterium]